MSNFIPHKPIDIITQLVSSLMSLTTSLVTTDRMQKCPMNLLISTNCLCSCYTVVFLLKIKLLLLIPIQISVNSLRPRQNGRLLTDDILKRIFLNENIKIWTKNSLKFVPKGLINNIPVLVLIMAWRRPGDKPLSEPMMVRSLMHICVTRPQWVDHVNKRNPVIHRITCISNQIIMAEFHLPLFGVIKHHRSMYIHINSLRPSDTYMHQ